MPQRYLAIESSSPRLSLAIGDDKKTIASFASALQWRHADSLFGGMQKLLSRRRWPVQSLTGVAVSIGPGSFTGIRVGLAAARALGQALKIPVVGVNALDIMAQEAPSGARWLCPMIDALRDQVYTALYERKGTGVLRCVEPPAIALRAEQIKHIHKISRDRALWISPMEACYPHAKALLNLARPRLIRASQDSYKRVLPLYLRQPAAQERLSLRRR